MCCIEICEHICWCVSRTCQLPSQSVSDEFKIACGSCGTIIKTMCTSSVCLRQCIPDYCVVLPTESAPCYAMPPPPPACNISTPILTWKLACLPQAISHSYLLASTNIHLSSALLCTNSDDQLFFFSLCSHLVLNNSSLFM